MKVHAIVIPLFVSVILWCPNISQCEEECKWPENRKYPKAFDDSSLSSYGRELGPISESPFMGRVLSLNTYIREDISVPIPTKFAIRNRNSERNVIFKPFLVENDYYQYNLTDLYCSGFDPKLRTVVLIGGFLSKETVPWIRDSTDLLLKLENVNVIEVTWSETNRYCYSRCVSATPIIARQITILLHYLAEITGYSLSSDDFVKNITSVGHSLGAHISGFLGQDLLREGGEPRLGHIIALDPAGPSFDNLDNSQRLNPTDALLVEAIHTNVGKMEYITLSASASTKISTLFSKKFPSVAKLGEYLLRNYTGEGNTAWFGLEANVGHIDYYANNGKVQPGCNDFLHICDHGRAHEIYKKILEREIQLRFEGFTESQLKDSRLLAFKSSKFSDFEMGRSFHELCESLIEQKSVEKLKSCSIPIDFMSSVDKVIEELKGHGVRFHPDYPESHTKYFFKTSDRHSLVGNHYLLKLHLATLDSWDPKCTLEIRLEFSHPEGNDTVTLDVTDIQKYNNNLDTIALTFIHTDEDSSKLLNELLPLYSDQINEQRKRVLERLFPQAIKFRIIKAKAKSVRENLSDKASRIWRKNKDFDVISKCQLTIDRMELHPITGHDINFSALYNLKLSDTNIEVISSERPMDQEISVTAEMEYESKLSAFLFKR